MPEVWEGLCGLSLSALAGPDHRQDTRYDWLRQSRPSIDHGRQFGV